MLKLAWDSYKDSCVCGYAYERNSAHCFSNSLIIGGFVSIYGGEGSNFRIVNGFCVCRSGRPVRAKEVRDWFGQNWVQHSSPRDGINLVYQERSGGGHVLMKMYKDRICVDYKGTVDHADWPYHEYYY